MKHKPKRSRQYRRFQFESLEPRRVLAAEAQLLGDFNPTIDRRLSSDPYPLAAVGDTLYFAASRPAEGTELWKTDGNFGGARLVKDIHPGTTGSAPTSGVAIVATLFFVATDDVHGPELWKSDGTAAGTVMVKDIDPDPDPNNFNRLFAPTRLTKVGGALFFSAHNPATNSYELWKSDGTAAGTVVVSRNAPAPLDLTAVEDRLYFRTSLDELWVSDGTANGTQRFTPAQGDVVEVANWGGTLMFATEIGTATELWRSDGTSVGTRKVRDIGSLGDTPDLTSAEIAGVQYFVANFANKGKELWRSDGTTPGTYLVKDIRAGVLGSQPANLNTLNGLLIFTADDGVSGRELWRSDGTAAGTVLVTDIATGENSPVIEEPVVFNNQLFFRGSVNGANLQLWVSDGTAGRTRSVPNNNPEAAVNPSGLTVLDDQLLFAATGTQGRELYAAAFAPRPITYLFADLAGIGVPTNPTKPVASNGKFYFTLNEEQHGRELWVSDGTPQGTKLVLDLWPGEEASNPRNLIDVKGQLYFTADDGVNGEALWKTNGTAAGTVRVKPTDGPGAPQQLYSFNGIVYFSATDPVNGRELWKSNGTAAGTRRVRDIYFGEESSTPSGFAEFQGRLYFSATNARSGRELWITDGTFAGTQLALDIVPGAESSNPGALFDYNGTLLFSANDGAVGQELWKSDGTAAGTVLVKDINPYPATQYSSGGSSPREFTFAGNTLFFTAYDDRHGGELWKTDGTAAGTVLVRDLTLGSPRYSNWPYSSSPNDLIDFGGVLYFSADTQNFGRELWKSDGSEEGTVLVKDIDPRGTYYNYYGFFGESSNIDSLTAIQGKLYFVATSPENGRNVFVSDGTTDGTQALETNLQGTSDRHGGWVFDANGAVVFSIPDVNLGQEIWRYSNPAWRVAVSGTSTFTEQAPLSRLAPSGNFTISGPVALDGARLVVSVVRNATADDRLGVIYVGTGPGQISYDGSEVSYGGALIGTMAGGVGSESLVITLNANATHAASLALLRAVGFRVNFDNPSTLPRLVAIAFVDADGAASSTGFRTVTVRAINDPPRLAGIGGSAGYLRGAAPVALASAAAVIDPDSANFAGGTLVVRFLGGHHAANRFTIGGPFVLVGNQIRLNGLTIATRNANGGVGITPLQINFNINATRAIVQQLTRSLRFSTIGATNTASRVIEFSLSDGDGGVSNRATKIVNVQ